MRSLTLFVSSALVLAGCSEAPPLNLPQGCQPLLNGHDCMLPYPSDFFIQEDGRVDLTRAAQLRTEEGISADFADRRTVRAFSRNPMIVTSFEEPIGREGLVTVSVPVDQSLSPATSATIIVNAETFAPVAHFADIDELDGDGTRNALVLHTRTALDAQTTYVAIIHGIKSTSGSVIAPAEGFRRLRDKEVGSDLKELATKFEDIVFPAIEGAGINRSTVQLAWHFTTRTDEAAVGDMREGRRLVLAALETTPPAVEITRIEENPTDPAKQRVWREIHGTIEVPLIVESDDPGARLNRDADGKVIISGSAKVPFLAVIPKSVQNMSTPARVLCYGHGFFGDRREILYGAQLGLAERLNLVTVAIDWWGMSLRDTGTLSEALVGAPSETIDFSERAHQGMMNWVALSRAIRTEFGALPEFQRPGGELTYDASRVHYMGISQGHILGGVLAAVNPDFDRMVLQVGGAGYAHMMYRAKPFGPFLELLEFGIPDKLDLLKYASTVQRHIDPIDPAAYAPFVFDEPFEGSPADRRLLLQLGAADTSVPEFTGMLHAHMLKAGLMQPSPIEVWGVEPYSDQPAALTYFDFGVDRAFLEEHKAPRSNNEVHEGIRRLDVALQQIDAFLSDSGEFMQPCNGACDPE